MRDRELADWLETAREAARQASALLAGARPSQVRSKSSPHDLVTEWDVRAEELVRRVLEQRTPGIAVLGEEGGQGEGASRQRWVVDPIDGTVNFAHGLPLWSISIALEEDGEPLVGVVAAPALGWWHEASRGGGAHDEHGAPLVVSSVARLAEALLVTGFPYDRATNPLDNFAEWEHLQRRAGACRRLGSAALDLCMVARGWMDGYWERHLKPWDVAAGALIAREAGATVTDIRGGPFGLHSGEVAASNGAIHGELIAELGLARPVG
ncbi:MAG: inositol monophosphatase family protein [Kofleriaceae bacterium]